jgi:dihydrofolate reductase
MRPLYYAINVTLDGCCDHRVGVPDEESTRYWADLLASCDALLFGRVTYRMMEEAWRRPDDGRWPEWMGDGEVAFAEVVDRARKHVVSSTLDAVDWNAELLRGDLGEAVRRLKDEPGGPVFVGGVRLPVALAELGLIDRYEFVVLPVVAGHGPRLLDGLREQIPLELIDHRPLRSGAIVTRYRPRPPAG